MFRSAVRLSFSFFLIFLFFFFHSNRPSAVLSPVPATLQCHPAPAVMGKGCGRASHQYSTTVSVQTHTNTGKTPFLNANRQTVVLLHIYAPIVSQRSVT